MTSRRQVAIIEIEGVHGERWRVSGPGDGAEGVILAESPDELHSEAPIKPIYQQSAFQEGATYVGHTIEPVDLVLGFRIIPPGNSDTWEQIEGRFFASFDPVKPARIIYTTPDGESRYLEVLKFAASKTASAKDPRLFNTSHIVMTLRAPWPYWRGEDRTVEGEVSAGESHTFKVANPTDRDIWLRWVLTAPGRWRVPDYSLDSDDGSDRNRRVITPNLTTGQDLTIDTYPLRVSYLAADGTNVAGQFGGVDFLYPVPPHTPPTDYTITYEGTEGSVGQFQCRMSENWLRPWGGRYVG